MLTLLNPITLLLATLCMTWVNLGSFGSFSVKLPYAALALVMAYACTGPRKLSNAVLMARRNAFWIAPLAAYLLMITVIQHGTPSAASTPRQIFYLLGCIALAGSISATPKLSRIFRVGSLIGFGAFVIAVEVLARRVGLGWERAIWEFVHGNLNFVVYSFFREVFNAIDPVNDPMGASTKNEVAVAALILGLLFRSASVKASRDIAGIVFMAGVFGLLLLLNTRSVLITAGGSLIVAMIVGALMNPGRSLPPLLFKGIALIAVMILVIGSSLETDAVSATLGSRFAFEDNSTAARLEQYRSALAAIEMHPFAGNGFFQVEGHPVHNLFLFSWVTGGLGAFVLAVAFYLGLLGAWITFLMRTVKRPQAWVLPVAVEWIAPLPLTPLFRVWQSGDGGNMFFGEWISIACFFGCCLANELRSRAVVRAIKRRFWGADGASPGVAQVAAR